MTMRAPTRRDFLCAAAATTAMILRPLRSLAAAVKPVTIREVEIFPIEIPVSRAEHEAGLDHHYTVVKIVTSAGVRGYSFAGPSPTVLPEVRKVLVGQDLFAVQQHLRHGLIQWGGVEHAVWDAIGKVAGQPVSRLLGGTADRVKPYITCVWKGNLDQSHVSYEEQARMAVKLKQAGFKGMKIRAWRPDPMDDVAACEVIKQAVGPDFALMFDRTADRPRRRRPAGLGLRDRVEGRSRAATAWSSLARRTLRTGRPPRSRRPRRQGGHPDHRGRGIPAGSTRSANA